MQYVLLTERLGSGLPIRPGGFDSHRALSKFLDASDQIRVWANGKPAAFEAVN